MCCQGDPVQTLEHGGYTSRGSVAVIATVVVMAFATEVVMAFTTVT